jgi:predicted SPOUT superfamily RNA methylase MTH1
MTLPTFALPAFKHMLIVFGGVYGLEEGIDGDDLIDARDPSELFDHYINACQQQGSRTIRTEEAIPITLSALRTHILRNGTVSAPPQ